MTESHEEKYERLCREWNVVWDKAACELLKETPKSMVRKFQEDEALNNIDLSKWDGISWPIVYRSRFKSEPRKQITVAESVCIYKHAARKFVLERMVS